MKWWLSSIFLCILIIVCTDSSAQTTSSFEPVKEESILVYTDKSSYLAGEILWFGALLKTDTVTTNFNSSRILYVELLNDAGKPVSQAKIGLTNGGGEGSFYLPLNVSTGVYTLAAYSSKLKNAGSGYFFYKKITVINTIRNSPPTDSLSDETARIQFFPESGVILNNVLTKVGVQVTETNTGHPLENTNGYIIENKKDTVARFLTGQLGLGQFMFMPRADKQYEGIISYAGTVSTVQMLPAVKNAGYHLSVTEETDLFRINITSANIVAGKVSLLVVSAESGLSFSDSFTIHSNKKSIDIAKSRLESGFTRLILMDNHNETVAERLIFSPGNASVQKLQLSTDKTVYSSREKINISIGNNNTSDRIKGSLSVSYFPEAGITPNEDWTTALTDSRNSYSATEMENLLLVYGSNNIKAGVSTNDDFVPEYDGHIVTARVTSSWNGQPAAGIRCVLSVPSAIPFGFYMGTSDSNGFVRFNVKKYYGAGDLIMKVFPEKNTASYKMEVIDPFANFATCHASANKVWLNKADSAELIRRSIAMQVTNSYYPEQVNAFQTPVFNDTLPFFGKAEFSYLLDDYKRFSTMEEVLREYVTNINVNLRNSKLRMTILDEKFQRIYDENILVLLNGVPLSDYNNIFRYDPLKIKKLDVVPRRYLVGNTAFSGIASFETYNSRFDAFDLDPAVVPVEYDGLQLNREFFIPRYENGNKGDLRIPDYRTTLLWKPDVALKENSTNLIETTSSDFKGRYRVVFNGLSEKGSPCYAETTFEIK
ncbi:hypothetical protein [Niabella aquatica]